MRQYSLTDSRACSRNSSSVISVRAYPVMAKPLGSKPWRNRFQKAGKSLRLVRSPEAPKITTACGRSSALNRCFAPGSRVAPCGDRHQLDPSLDEPDRERGDGILGRTLDRLARSQIEGAPMARTDHGVGGLVDLSLRQQTPLVRAFVAQGEELVLHVGHGDPPSGELEPAELPLGHLGQRRDPDVLGHRLFLRTVGGPLADLSVTLPLCPNCPRSRRTAASSPSTRKAGPCWPSTSWTRPSVRGARATREVARVPGCVSNPLVPIRHDRGPRLVGRRARSASS